MNFRSASLVLPILVTCLIPVALACRPAQAPAASAPDGDGSAPISASDGGASPEGSTDEAHPVAGGSSEGTNVGGGVSPLATVLVTDPAEVQRIFDSAKSAPKATTKPNGVAGPGPLAAGVRDSAKTAASGMKADGPLVTGKLEEKKNLRTEITLRPGRCFTIVGYSAKVTDLDLYLLLAPGVLSGQDTTDDNKPVIGKTPDAMCPVFKSAVKYTLDIVADQGAGEFAVQLYSKKAPKKDK